MPNDTQDSDHYRNTKIICTIGPATNSSTMIEKLIMAGMDVARLNFSHGDHETHRNVIKHIHAASAKLGKQVGILQDLSGPKIRLGKLNSPSISLAHNQKVVLSYGEIQTGGEIPVNYPHIAEDVAVGARILLADGLVELSVTGVEKEKVFCVVQNAGIISSHKGVNMPLANLRIPAFTDKDRADLEFGLNEGVDFVAMSFVRNADDLKPVREAINSRETKPLLFAKIEKPEAIEKLDEILSFVDGIMVARGDLGVEMSLEQLPMVQKRIISAARRMAKPVITATQMLRSMIDNPRPTRAEATDTANAILDGTSALMLSEETATGDYPVEAVAVLDRISRITERHIDFLRLMEEPDSPSLAPVESAITRGAVIMAQTLDAACIAVITSTGSSASLVGRFRPNVPIVGITCDERTVRKMSIFWGVIPILETEKKNLGGLADKAIEFIKKHNLAKPGDRVILTSGYPPLCCGNTDMIKAITVP